MKQRQIIGKKRLITVVGILLSLIITLLGLKPFVTCMFVLAVFVIIWSQNRRKKYNTRLIKNAVYLMLLVILLCVLQIVILGSSVLKNSITINLIIFFPLITVILLSGIRDKEYVIPEALAWFDILFSSYYIFMLLAKGIPEDRNSVLGYVSSNFCAAVLFLTFPAILYRINSKSLFVKEKRLYYSAIILSTIMILTSGSRTSFGVLLVVFCSLILLQEKSLSKKIRQLGIILLAFFGIYFLYLYVPSINLMVERAMRAINGLYGGGVEGNEKDVRIYLWKIAFQLFEKSNKLIGTTSNIVTVFGVVEQAHNLVIELLLADGIMGLVLYLLMLIAFGRHLYGGVNSISKFFLTQLLALFIIVAAVQPFFTTNIACAIIISLSGLAIHDGGLSVKHA